MQLVIMDSDKYVITISRATHSTPTQPPELQIPIKTGERVFISTHRQDNLFNLITHQFLVSMSTKNSSLAIFV